MKNPMKSTVSGFDVYALFTHPLRSETRMDKGPLRCLRDSTQNTHVCACACVCAGKHRKHRKHRNRSMDMRVSSLRTSEFIETMRKQTTVGVLA